VPATRGGQPVGQASPSSFIQYLDGDQVTGTVESLSVTGGQALISADTFAGADLTDSATNRYHLASGTLGAALSDDSGLHDGQDRPGRRNRIARRDDAGLHGRRRPRRQGNALYVAAGSAQPDPEEGDFPASTYFTVDQSTLTRTPADSIGTFGPAWVTYDPVHNVIVEASVNAFGTGIERFTY
jgi:hypothetical protein